jgi:hypothetical protein
MSAQWICVIGTSISCFAFKYLGHSVPASWLEHPRLQRINALIPIVLLSALVAVQSFTDKSKLAIDHRAAGVTIAVAALVAKAPFPLVVVSAGATSALIYHWH